MAREYGDGLEVSLHELEEADMEDLCGPDVLSRGRPYQRRGAFGRLTYQDGTLTAAVQGSRPAPGFGKAM